MSNFILLALDEVSLDTTNPRGHIDKGRIAELAESIRTHGVIQPIIVRKNQAPTTAATPYTIVAGQRRYLASIEAGATTIPGLLRDVNGDASAIALVENLQREELTPIEEAKAFEAAIHGGMTPTELAAAISRSTDFISGRLALLQLPVKVQQHIGLGELTLRSAAALKLLAPAGDAVVTMAAELVSQGRDEDRMFRDPVTVNDLETDTAWVLEQVLDELKDKAPFLVDLHDLRHRYAQIVWPKGCGVDAKALLEKIRKLPEYVNGRMVRGEALVLTADELDAARAYGCLLELPGRGQSGVWINDPAWLADRLNEKLDKAIASHDRKAKTAAKKAGASSADVAKVKSADDAAKLERQAQREKMLATREANVTLGIALYKNLHAPEPTLENMQLVAGLLLEYAGEDLGRRGLRYTDEQSQTVTTRKDGTISRVTHLRGVVECRTLLQERLEKATTPEQVLGVLLQAIGAAHYAKKEAAPVTDRGGQVRGLDGYGVTTLKLQPLVKTVIGPALP